MTAQLQLGELSITGVDPHDLIKTARPQPEPSPTIPLVALAVALTLTVVALLGLRAGVAETARIDGMSMAPTLQDGQVVLVNKLDRTPERGDLLTLRSPVDGERILKRAIGLGGDVVEVRDGILFVNGTAVKEPYLDRNSIEGLYYGPVTVGKGSVLVLGDQRANSIDSRSHGDVPLQDVTGTAMVRLWPPGPIPFSRWTTGRDLTPLPT